MNHWKTFVSAVAFTGLLGACAPAPHGLRYAAIDGRRVAYEMMGSGPVLVMMAGLGDGRASFEEVAPDLARHATVLIYDRAGYGASAPAPGPRDAAAVERELASVLAQAGVKGPFVLLGHSLGGTYAEYYASRHPDQVAGLILEESRPADFTRRCASAGLKMCVAPAALMRFEPKGAQDEYAALAATMREVESAPLVRGKAVLVLSRSVDSNARGFDAAWAAAQRDLAARYRARQLIARPSGHYIHRDQRAWFVDVVTAFLRDRLVRR